MDGFEYQKMVAFESGMLINKLKAENGKLKEYIKFAIDYLPESPDKALGFLKGINLNSPDGQREGDL